MEAQNSDEECGDAATIEEQIERQETLYEEMDQESYLPLLMCKACKEECEPRSAYHFYVASSTSCV